MYEKKYTKQRHFVVNSLLVHRWLNEVLWNRSGVNGFICQKTKRKIKEMLRWAFILKNLALMVQSLQFSQNAFNQD